MRGHLVSHIAELLVFKISRTISSVRGFDIRILILVSVPPLQTPDTKAAVTTATFRHRSVAGNVIDVRPELLMYLSELRMESIYRWSRTGGVIFDRNFDVSKRFDKCGWK
jgi:hypothetical protein